MTKPAHYDIFISYSRRDEKSVRQVVNKLRECGFSVWFDQISMCPGDRIRESIFEAISKSTVVLIFLSQHSIQSRWVLNELDSAMMREMQERKTLVVPIVIGRISDDKLPGDVAGKLYFDLRHNFARNWENKRENIVTSLAALIWGEASSGDELIFQVGDPLMRFFANYKFRHNGQSAHVEELTWAKVARVFGIGAISLAGNEDESDKTSASRNTHSVSNIEDCDEKGRDRTRRYTPGGLNFIERYGEFGLQQITLFLLDQVNVDLTSWFQEDQLTELLSSIQVLVELFNAQFLFEKFQAERSHHILARVSPTGIEFKLVGDINLIDQDLIIGRD